MSATSNEITFYKQVCYTLTYKKFRKNFCDDDVTDAEAIRLWEVMVKNAGKKQEVECDDDGCENDDWAEDDIVNHIDEAMEEIGEAIQMWADNEKAKEEELNKIDKELNQIEKVLTN